MGGACAFYLSPSCPSLILLLASKSVFRSVLMPLASMRLYRSSRWNIFDGIVVMVSITSLFLNGTNVKSIRLLRVCTDTARIQTFVRTSLIMIAGAAYLFRPARASHQGFCTRAYAYAHMPSHTHHNTSHHITGVTGNAVGGAIPVSQVGS